MIRHGNRKQAICCDASGCCRRFYWPVGTSALEMRRAAKTHGWVRRRIYFPCDELVKLDYGYGDFCPRCDPKA